MKSEAYNQDCLEAMRAMDDNQFDLACVDPPYGIKASNNARANTQHGKALATSKDYGFKTWDFERPSDEYFSELRRVSTNQIIWGGNYYGLSGTPCFIVWDKKNGNNGYADCELAWSSFPTAVRMFSYQWHGMLQENMANKEVRIHPTQKPVALCEYLIKTYTNEGEWVLDNCMGSGTTGVACVNTNRNFIGIEQEEKYFIIAKQRIMDTQGQPTGDQK